MRLKPVNDKIVVQPKDNSKDTERWYTSRFKIPL